MYVRTDDQDHPHFRSPLAWAGGLAQPVASAAVALGTALWDEAPAGIKVAIYYADDEQKRRAIDWAARERALGARTKVAVANLSFGLAIADAGDLVAQLTQLGAALKVAVNAVPAPTNVTPLPQTGPSLIRTLTLFTHGTNTWMSIGGGIMLGNVDSVIRKISPTLTDDVKVVLYGCSSALGTSEASDWRVTTTTAGGASSLAGKLRDALVDAGKTRATVWGHTQVGHATRNPSLRVFSAGFGKGTPGRPYLDTVFGTLADAQLREEIAEAIVNLGHLIPAAQQEAFRKAAQLKIRDLRYDCYLSAVIRVRGGTRATNLTFRGGNLPEMAPHYPLDVAQVIRDHWSATCWTATARTATAKDLIRKLRLPK